MDEAMKNRLEDAWAALAELGAAQQEALSLLKSIQENAQKGDMAKALNEEASLRESMTHLGRALLDLSRAPIVGSGER